MKFPDLKLVIGGVTYFIPRSNYLLYEMGYCGVEILSHPLITDWLLGLNFFENYYTIFDRDNHRVGFAPSKESNVTDLIQVNEYNSQNVKLNQTLAIGALCVTLGILGLIFKRRKSHDDFTKNTNTQVLV